MGEAFKWFLDGISLRQNTSQPQRVEKPPLHDKFSRLNRSIGKGCGSAKLPVPTQWACLRRACNRGRRAHPDWRPTKAGVGCTVSSGSSLEAGETFPLGLLAYPVCENVRASDRPWGLGTMPQQEGALYSGTNKTRSPTGSQ